MAPGHVERVGALFDLVAEEYDQHVPFFTAYAQRFVPWLEVSPSDLFLDKLEAAVLEHLSQMLASGGIVLDRVAVFAKGRKADA